MLYILIVVVIISMVDLINPTCSVISTHLRAWLQILSISCLLKQLMEVLISKFLPKVSGGVLATVSHYIPPKKEVLKYKKWERTLFTNLTVGLHVSWYMLSLVFLFETTCIMCKLSNNWKLMLILHTYIILKNWLYYWMCYCWALLTSLKIRKSICFMLKLPKWKS